MITPAVERLRDELGFPGCTCSGVRPARRQPAPAREPRENPSSTRARTTRPRSRGAFPDRDPWELHRPRPLVARGARDRAGAGRARPRQRGAHEPPGRIDRATGAGACGDGQLTPELRSAAAGRGRGERAAEARRRGAAAEPGRPAAHVHDRPADRPALAREFGGGRRVAQPGRRHELIGALSPTTPTASRRSSAWRRRRCRPGSRGCEGGHTSGEPNPQDGALSAARAHGGGRAAVAGRAPTLRRGAATARGGARRRFGRRRGAETPNERCGGRRISFRFAEIVGSGVAHPRRAPAVDEPPAPRGCAVRRPVVTPVTNARSGPPAARSRPARAGAPRHHPPPVALVDDVDRVVLAVRAGDRRRNRQPAPEAEPALAREVAGRRARRLDAEVAPSLLPTPLT